MKRNALRFRFGILLSGFSLLFQFQTLAITVTNLNDSGPGSLRQAISDTPAEGTIDFAVTGTIVLTSGQLVITNDLTVNGPGATNLILSQISTNRILLVSNGKVTISGLSIANGRLLAYDGGGAGVKNLAALALRGSRITSNYAYGNGGGIHNQGTLVVQDSLVASNTAVGLYYGNGGGVYNQGTLVVQNSLITSNTAIYDGGGIANAGTATIIGSTICSNNADIYHQGVTAGGIHNWSFLVVTQSTISCNQRCGIISFCGTNFVFNSTLANNQQEDLGLECGFPPHNLTIRNSIIGVCAGWPVNSGDYNLVKSAPNGTWFVGATSHNIYSQDPKLGPLAYNGGPTPTHALRFDSPAIDAGHSGGATTDQRGLPRTIDDPNTPNANGGDGSDIGAYESDPLLRVTSIDVAVGEIRVGFNSVLGRNYSLESETNWDNSWTKLTNNIAGTGSAYQPLDAGTNNHVQQFFRVMLLP